MILVVSPKVVNVGLEGQLEHEFAIDVLVVGRQAERVAQKGEARQREVILHSHVK